MSPLSKRAARYFTDKAGYYNEAVHGFRTVFVPRHVESSDIREFPRVEWDEVPNPDCLIPADAVEISESEWLERITGRIAK